MHHPCSPTLRLTRVALPPVFFVAALCISGLSTAQSTSPFMTGATALQTKTFGRSGGSSAPSAAAYRAGERIRDERTGRTYDHTDRRDVMQGDCASESIRGREHGVGAGSSESLE